MSESKERLAYAITLDTEQLEAATKRVSNGFSSMGSNIENESKRIDNSMKAIGTAAAAYFSVSALNSFARSVIQVRGEIESLEISFATLLGSTDKAKELFGEIREFEVKTPMTLEPLAKGAQTLLGFGVAAEKVMPILRQIGDISMGNAERFQSLVLAFAQASANGKLMGQDLLQMINAGFNPLNQMSKETGKSIAELREEMSAGAISAEDMERAFAGATAEGGQFYGMLEKQSEGINGALSNLEGAWNSVLNDIGSSQQNVFVSGVNMLTNMVEHYDVFLNAILSVAAAYGTYKAALMAVWVIEKARALTDTIRLIAMFRKELGLLTAAQQTFNITALANPYVLLAAAIVGVISALVLYTDHTSDAEKAQAKLNEESDKFREKLDEERQAIENCINTIRDKTETDYAQAAAYSRLRQLCPELTNEYTMQELATADLADTTKRLNEVQEEQEYQHLTEDLRRYKTALDEARQGIGSMSKESAELFKSFKGSPLSRMMQLQDVVNTLQTSVDEIEAARKEAEQNALPLETKLQFAIKERDSIQKEFESVKKEVEEQQRKAQAGLGIWNVDVFLNVRFRNLQEGLKNAESKVSILQSQVDNQPTFQEDYASAKEAWEKAKSKLDKINRDRNQYTTQQYKDAKEALEKAEKSYKELGGETGSSALSKQANEQKKLLQEIAKERKQLLIEASNEEVSAMQEGLAKRLREIENQKAQTLAAIDQEEKELAEKLSKTGQTLSDSDKTAYQAKRDAANTAATNATREAEEENAKYIKGLYENLADVFVSEEERKLNAIRNTYQEQRRQLGKDLAGGSISQEQYNDLSGKINAAEAQETANMWISAYGDYYQKREQLQKEWESRLAVIPVEYQEEAVKKYKEALSNLDMEANKTTSAISALFGNMKDKTLQELEAINERGQAALDFLKGGKWDESKGAEFGISKETFDVWSKSPDKLKDISDALRDNKRAADELRPALDKVVNGLQDLFNSGNDTKKIRQALSDVQDGLSEVMQATSFLADTFSNLGDAFGSDAMSGIADGLNVAMDSVNAAMQGAQAGSMFGPIGAAAGAAAGLVTSLASSIAKIHDAKNEKRIQALQDQIDALDRSYEKLGDSIEESYSKDASKLIEQNNKLLEQQKLLIQQQIREEEDKKKTDDERIKEWQQQIEDINDLIEDNKEKAVDAIFGETLQSAIENFSETYAEAWANGENRAESAKDTVKKLMQQMVTESIKAAVKSSNSMEQIRQKLQEFYADNVLSGWEQDYIYNMAEQLQQRLDQQFGWADSLFKSDNVEEPERTSAEKSGITASQESVDRVDGRLTVMQGHTYNINEGIKELNVLGNKMLEHLAGIENNTAKIDDTNEKLDTISERIGSMSNALNDIQLKGVKLKK